MLFKLCHFLIFPKHYCYINSSWKYLPLSLQEFFENPAFRPDGLKLYPTLVIRGTGLYELWKTGRYKSYPPSTLVDLVARILALVPPWTRVYRVQRLESWPSSETLFGYWKYLKNRIKGGNRCFYSLLFLFLFFFVFFISVTGQTLGYLDLRKSTFQQYHYHGYFQ